MSRKTRNGNKNSNPNNERAQQTDEPIRFLQWNPVSDAATGETVVFSVGVGASDAPSTPAAKPKPTSIWSRLFGSSKKERKEPVASVASASSHRSSFWQRSKSILRPRSNLDRSKSVFIDLPHLKIVGSGSAAQLLNHEDTCEFALDYYGMLENIFEENDAFFRAEKKCAEYEQVAQINEDGLLSPASTTSEAAAGTGFEFEDDVATFVDNPKLDSPLLPDEEAECFEDCSVSDQQQKQQQEDSDLSGSSLSMESAINSFISGDFSLEGLKSYSTDEVALMFGLLTVDDHPPQVLPDGSVRCLVQDENGSLESIRFQNCWKPQCHRQTRSEDNLKLTEIRTSDEVPPQKHQHQHQLSLKQRCQSLAHFSKASQKDLDLSTDLAASRRRSLGAKVSQIVAMYENVALHTPK